MNKKIAVGISIIVILATLSVNIIFSNSPSDEGDLTFDNIDALAENEGTEEVQCIKSGTICIGRDAEGTFSRHPGLQHNPAL